MSFDEIFYLFFNLALWVEFLIGLFLLGFVLAVIGIVGYASFVGARWLCRVIHRAREARAQET